MRICRTAGSVPGGRQVRRLSLQCVPSSFLASRHERATAVTTAAGKRFVALLGEVVAPGAFSARQTAPADDLHLEVRGLGQLLLPVPDAQARQLCRLGRPARYGRGEQTLRDPQVRDTWEIPKSRVKIDKRQWNKTLRPVLDCLRGDLGLPSGCELKAELHSMLVYARGQFFAAHQDSERADTMVGSLVVTLPSSFKGGALVVEHGGEVATYRSSKESLSFVAFYADCRHQIRPVKSGYRVVLTYNLLLDGETATAATTEAAPGAVDALAQCLDEHFTTPVPSPRRFVGADRTDPPPNRLVYLLDHEYTGRALSRRLPSSPLPAQPPPARRAHRSTRRQYSPRTARSGSQAAGPNGTAERAQERIDSHSRLISSRVRMRLDRMRS